jgi:hypothetical protein
MRSRADRQTYLSLRTPLPIPSRRRLTWDKGEESLERDRFNAIPKQKALDPRRCSAPDRERSYISGVRREVVRKGNVNRASRSSHRKQRQGQ